MKMLIKEVLRTVDMEKEKILSSYGGIARCDIYDDTSLERLNQYLRQDGFEERHRQNKPFFHYIGIRKSDLNLLFLEFWIARKLPGWEDLAGPRIVMISKNLDLLRKSMQEFPERTGYTYVNLEHSAFQESENTLKLHAETLYNALYGKKIYQPEISEGWYREII